MKVFLLVLTLMVAFDRPAFAAADGGADCGGTSCEEAVEKKEDKLREEYKSAGGRPKVVAAFRLFILRAARVLCEYTRDQSGKDHGKSGDPEINKCMHRNLQTIGTMAADMTFPAFCKFAAKRNPGRMPDCKREGEKANKLAKGFNDQLARGNHSAGFAEKIIDESNKFGASGEDKEAGGGER